MHFEHLDFVGLHEEDLEVYDFYKRTGRRIVPHTDVTAFGS